MLIKVSLYFTFTLYFLIIETHCWLDFLSVTAPRNPLILSLIVQDIKKSSFCNTEAHYEGEVYDRVSHIEAFKI